MLIFFPKMMHFFQHLPVVSLLILLGTSSNTWAFTETFLPCSSTWLLRYGQDTRFVSWPWTWLQHLAWGDLSSVGWMSCGLPTLAPAGGSRGQITTAYEWVVTVHQEEPQSHHCWCSSSSVLHTRNPGHATCHPGRGACEAVERGYKGCLSKSIINPLSISPGHPGESCSSS